MLVIRYNDLSTTGVYNMTKQDILDIGNAHYKMSKTQPYRSYESACRQIAYMFNVTWAQIDTALARYYSDQD